MRTDILQPLKARYRKAVWQTDPATRPRAAAWTIRAARLTQALALDIQGGQLTLRAMSLVYTTLLSIVPLLAFSFSVLKAMGAHNQMRPALLKFLAPLGDKAEVVAGQIVGFVERVDVGVLGAVGVAFLVFTVLSLVHKVEEAFNFIWRIRHARGFAQRFAAYLSVLLIGPFLVFAALGVTASLMSTTLVQKMVAIAPFGALLHLGTRVLPYLLVMAAFTVTYIFIPNTRVRPGAALAGGVAAGLLWETVGWGFGTFMVGSTKYTAIYSGFAILVLFMVWLFLNWLILLVGATVAFYVQHPEYQRGDTGTPVVSGRLKERLALLAMVAVGRRHYNGEPPWALNGLTAWLGVPTEVTHNILSALQDRGLLVTTSDDPGGYVPARDLERIALADVVRAVRSSGDTAPYPVPAEPAVEGVIEQLDLTLEEALGHTTLRGLVRARPAEPARAADPRSPAGGVAGPETIADKKPGG